MTLIHNGGDDYTLVDEHGQEIMRGTYFELMDWAFPNHKDEED